MDMYENLESLELTIYRATRVRTLLATVSQQYFDGPRIPEPYNGTPNTRHEVEKLCNNYPHFSELVRLAEESLANSLVEIQHVADALMENYFEM